MEKELETTTEFLGTPKVKLESTKKTFYYNGAVEYNSLPLRIRTEATYHDFCKKLDIYLNP